MRLCAVWVLFFYPCNSSADTLQAAAIFLSVVIRVGFPDTTTINAPVVITIGAGTTAYPLTDCNCAQATAESIHTRTRYATRVETSATGTGTFKYFGCFCRSHAGAPASIS